MIDADDIADSYKNSDGENSEMKTCACDAFKDAVRDRLIQPPGNRIPHTQSFSKEYFITRYDERKEMNHFMYIKHCPNCGQAIKRGDKR